MRRLRGRENHVSRGFKGSPGSQKLFYAFWHKM
jgi:hypothetical protein